MKKSQNIQVNGENAGPTESQILRAYSPAQIAQAIGWHEESVRLAIRHGRIPAKRFGRTWRTAHADLVAIMANGIPRIEPKAAA